MMEIIKCYILDVHCECTGTGNRQKQCTLKKNRPNKFLSIFKQCISTNMGIMFFKVNKIFPLLFFICAVQPLFAQHKPIIYDTLDNWLTVGTTINVVFEKLGEPDSVGDEEIWGTTGLKYRYYQYKRWGLSFYSEHDNDLEFVYDIIIQGTSTFHTSRGVSIGDNKSSVLHKYADCLKNEFAADFTDASIINSIYAGTFFFYDKEKVVKIEIGALAE